MSRARATLVGLALACAACSQGGGPVFIALDRDFAPFHSWERVALGDQPLSGHPPGPRFGYLNRRAPGASSYPVDTIIVKTVEPGADETQWDVFAMVKRGGGFNAGGARDWEFFRLKIDPGGTPYILSRGITAFDPSMDGGGGYFGPVAGAIADLCNSCHGTPASAATDHVLSPELAPGTL